MQCKVELKKSYSYSILSQIIILTGENFSHPISYIQQNRCGILMIQIIADPVGPQVNIERGRGGEMLETEKKVWYFRPYFWGDKGGRGWPLIILSQSQFSDKCTIRQLHSIVFVCLCTPYSCQA